MTRRPPPDPEVEIKRTLPRPSGERSLARMYRALGTENVALLVECHEDGTAELFRKALSSTYAISLTRLFVDHALIRWLNNRQELRIRSETLLRLLCGHYRTSTEEILIDSDGVIAGIFVGGELMGFMPENTLLTMTLRTNSATQLERCREDGTTQSFEQALTSVLDRNLAPLFVDHSLLRWLTDREELTIRSKALLRLICDHYKAQVDDILIESDGVIAGIFINDGLMGFMTERALLNLPSQSRSAKRPEQPRRRPSREPRPQRRTQRPALPPIGGLIKTRYGLVPASSRIFREQLREQSLGVNDQPRTRLKHD